MRVCVCTYFLDGGGGSTHTHKNNPVRALVYVHASFVCIQMLYPLCSFGFLSQKTRDHADRLYAIVMTLVVLHWVPLGNECLLSVLEKRALDPSYRAGECPFVLPTGIWLCIIPMCV